MIALSFWHTFKLFLVYFEPHNGHKNNVFCAHPQRYQYRKAAHGGLLESRSRIFLLRYLLVYSSVGTKHYLIPPFISTKSHLLCSLPPSMCSAGVFTALIKAFFCGGSKIISLKTFVDLFLNIIC